ncbi:GH116 family glycosyl-hydrolase [Paenibacillus allorhizosphaerae]|uniref:Glycosyl-hydrolase family 116 catalytic region domain-containing protein n=1 Tax=Paenibacillus allorhizosphaerae TaxID=2849866 RepID=A0ABM8VCZ8_9BACL|nr:GH116 family glycosyl-hydrolase [Paenibacillus allorhizosphaerae]CAG7626002.1 hypothetical protein PAECIP111802_01206 [Paenibacillus allorhizosphaerae]
MTYSRDELFEPWKPRTFPREAKEAAFLLGGIGTGNISLGSRGELRDWEFFNRPGKGRLLPNSYFAIWAKQEGSEPVAKVLESRLNPPFTRGTGYHPITGYGLPRMDHSVLHGEYPVAKVDFEDTDLPVKVELEAYTPFIPLNPEDSGIPGAVFTYRVTNISKRRVDLTIAGSFVNPVGGTTYSPEGYQIPSAAIGNTNTFKQEEAFSGLYFHSEQVPANALHDGNMSIVTTNSQVTYKRAWLRGPWYDFLQEFWDDFAEDGLLNDLGYDQPAGPKQTDTGTLGVRESLEPGETKEIRFILTWFFPNRINGWNEGIRDRREGKELTKNHYANRFNSSWEVAAYLVDQLPRLEKDTYAFRDALFASSLPAVVLDALSSNITVLRSTTCFWLMDGRFLAFEGSGDTEGSCDGNCNHVWNYAQTLAFLFPTLEQSMRRTEFLEEVEEDGKLNFRVRKMFDCAWQKMAASDGQLGAIMRVYREWKLTGDDVFLREVWPGVKKALDYAFRHWDTDGDLVLDGVQHNTYDIEFYGPNPLASFMFLGALRAGEEIARYLGEESEARNYRDAFEKSSARADDILWNGQFYVQRLDDVNRYKYQHGLGCLSDQVLAQQLAHLYGLGYLLPEQHVKSAIRSVYANNFKTDFRHHINCQRVYAINDEKGLVLCSWPNGGRPRLPFVYSDEVWTGIEYQVAVHLIYEGFVEEGLTVVKAVRDRYDGVHRNPWNEVECGHHYARSLASWGLLNALGGFQFDMVRKELKFDPVINKEHFTTFWSTGKAWGTFTQWKTERGTYEVKADVLYGDASGILIHACGQQICL